MQKWAAILIFLLPSIASASKPENLRLFFLHLSELDFEKARQNAIQEKNSLLQFEMHQLTDILFYEGQKDRAYFKLSNARNTDDSDKTLLLIRSLNAGYLSLFYDHVKGDAYKSFYNAYQLAKQSENPILIKASLMALLKYYNLEIAQNSDSYMPYLKHLESLQSDPYDSIWVTLYKMIFYSKSLEKIEDAYFRLNTLLDEYEKNMDPGSPLLAHIFYEKALRFDLSKDPESAEPYYRKTIDQARDYPFLRYHRFFALVKLMIIETKKKNFQLAQNYLDKARTEINRSDTLRSNYHLNLYQAHFLQAQHKSDSAFTLLWKAYTEDFKLDFRRNTLEINRLNVELETQEKENANLRLSKSRTWLISALVGVASLFLVSYFAYANQRSKNTMQAKEREVQAMKIEKLLKDQELFGIDAMIEGQEKERQRIANDLHDNLGSLIATIKLHFQTLKIRKGRDELEDVSLLQKTDDLIEEAYQKVRSIAHAKNAGVNAQDGLLPAVKNFASKVSILNKLDIEVEEHGMDERVENGLEITIFRIIQELITNVIKHAQATEVIIHLTHYEDAINLMVEDNGIGFDISRIKPEETMGLYSIQKRIENLGGKVTIDSIVQRGTSVIIDIPLV